MCSARLLLSPTMRTGSVLEVYFFVRFFFLKKTLAILNVENSGVHAAHQNRENPQEWKIAAICVESYDLRSSQNDLEVVPICLIFWDENLKERF